MTKIQNTNDLGVNRAIDLPGKVAVIAQRRTVVGLEQLADTLSLHQCELDQMPSRNALGDAEIIVAEVDPAHEGSIQRLDEIAAMRPDVPIIAGVDALDIRTTRALLKRGVTDLLEIPFSIEELLDALADVDLSNLPNAQAEVELAPMITFVGCAGGVGATTLATHFAGAWVDEGGSCTLLDLDIQKGDAGDYLGMSNRQTLQELIEADRRLDRDLLNSVIARREGMPDVLAAPEDILPIEDVRFDRLEPVFDLVRRQSEIMVVDMPAELTNWGLSTLYASQQIVLVGGLNVHMLRKMRRMIDFLLSMGIDREAIRVVVNRAPTGLFKTINQSEAEDALRHPICAVIPEEAGIVQQAQDQGELVWSVARRSKFEKALRHCVDELIDTIEAEE